MQAPTASAAMRGIGDGRHQQHQIHAYRQHGNHAPAAKSTVATSLMAATGSTSSSGDSLSSPPGSPLMVSCAQQPVRDTYMRSAPQFHRGHGDTRASAGGDRNDNSASASGRSRAVRDGPTGVPVPRCGVPRAVLGRQEHHGQHRHQAHPNRGRPPTTATAAPTTVEDRRPRASVTVPMLPLCETDEDAQAVRALSGDKRYAVVRRLGSGASSTVFLACDRLRSDALVAIKVVSDAKVSRSEILAGMLLSGHPNMATMIDWFAARDHYFLVFEHVDGPDLQVLWAADVPDTRAFFAEDTFRRVFLCVLDAVAYCHTRGVVHRDIKMENVVVRDEGASACLVDFGFAFFVRPPRALLADHAVSAVPLCPSNCGCDGCDGACCSGGGGGGSSHSVAHGGEDKRQRRRQGHADSDRHHGRDRPCQHQDDHNDEDVNNNNYGGRGHTGASHVHDDDDSVGSGSDGEGTTMEYDGYRSGHSEARARPCKRGRTMCVASPSPVGSSCGRPHTPQRAPTLDCIYRRNREGMLVAVRMDTPDALNASNAFVGTEEYCAPELTLGALVDPEDLFATDIYSLGVLLHVGLTNRFPQRPSFVRFLVETRQRLERAWHGVDPRVALADPRLIAEINRRGALDLATVPLSIEACDLIARMLRPVPAERITLAEIHTHPWVVAGRRRHHRR
ncbi:Serine/threonine protein kinase incomplete domain containing protein [Pandoravirus neocaledonia]|uniref:Serine/threonine protein kinase incomplete domain containing protein n=1 Tax=Pandoravirus neocaledonia TaxID=2107708 RepID=A0A2U7UBA5_9VIRU|nr:Serine/threonine protein kinase incomplete domain containing protein [Pandoravirus neocaledonia]AVK75738.1 Serine/threonine protein kinase incomplete domain containing protein [Pandoravirus neocaledonia]